MKFEKWMNALDKALLARFEVGVDDLAMCEQDFKILFLHGYSFTQAADQIASDQGLHQDEIADQEDMDVGEGE